MFIMKLTIDFFTAFSCFITVVSCMETYLYEKQNFFGLGRRLIPKPRQIVINFDSGGHPGTLPTEPPTSMLFSAARSLYQGARVTNDTRVFRRRFEYEALNKGHQITCEGIFDCYLTFLALESTEAIPVLLRGGVGYRHFSAIVKAKPGRELKGQVRAYCKQEEPEKEVPALRSLQRFKFEKIDDIPN